MNLIDKLEACKAIFTHDTYYLIVSNECKNDIVSEVKSNIKDTETVRKKLIKSLKEDIKILQEYKRLSNTSK